MRYVLRYALVAFYTAFWGTMACALAPFDRSGRGFVWCARSWVGWIVRSCGIRVDVEGLDGVPRDRACVYMSNHQSVIDIVAIAGSLPGVWKFVAKRELTWIPLFGWALLASRQVIVDRADRARSVRSLENAAERVRGGASVIIFPEGTRSADGGLQAFKSGGFHLALRAGVPIVPITVSGTLRITPKRSLRIESGRVLVRFGRPIPTQGLGLDERDALKRRVRAAILAGYDAELQGTHAEVARDARIGTR